MASSGICSGVSGKKGLKFGHAHCCVLVLLVLLCLVSGDIICKSGEEGHRQSVTGHLKVRNRT